jgi:hypothetical protein
MIGRPAALAAVAAGLLTAGVSAAQTGDPIPRFVADVRGAAVGLPTATGWTPVVPVDTVVPSRALGVDVGAHARLMRLGPATLGVGAALVTARGTTSPEAAESETVAGPEVSTRLTSIAPQLSLNFGRRLGWSYVGAGFGWAKVSSEASAPAAAGLPASVEHEWSGALNFGGGARWFVNDHLGVGFDLRWHRLASVAGTATRPPAPRETLFVVGVGVSLQ